MQAQEAADFVNERLRNTIVDGKSPKVQTKLTESLFTVKWWFEDDEGSYTVGNMVEYKVPVLRAQPALIAQHQQGVMAGKVVSGGFHTGGVVGELGRRCRGVYETVFHPARENVRWPVWEVVMNLNDGHGWTRGEIADWLETLDVDLTI